MIFSGVLFAIRFGVTSQNIKIMNVSVAVATASGIFLCK